MIKIFCGDITQQTTVSIVNAANPALSRGSGVCGAIHRVAGPGLEEECRKIGYCPTGEARLTKAYEFPCEYVIHAVAPRYSDGKKDEKRLLTHCYNSIFELTQKHKIPSISIPAIGTGIYKYPITEATEIAFKAARLAKKKQSLEIYFVCFDEHTEKIYKNNSRQFGTTYG